MAGRIHAVCVPFPAQGHITPMLQLAKLLHSQHFHITFVNTEYNHRRLLRSNGPDFLDGTDSFRFETFPDGLPHSDADATQHVPSLIDSLLNTPNCLRSFVQLLRKLNDPSSDTPPVSLIISDVVVPFALDASRELGDLPVVFFWPASACSYLGYAQYRTLVESGIVPFQDPSFMTDGSLDKLVEWVPSMKDDVGLKNLPCFIRTMDKNQPIVHFVIGMVERCSKSPIIFNTFDALEHESLQDISLTVTTGPTYSVGPLLLPSSSLRNGVTSMGSHLWKKDSDSKCFEWLDSCKPNSVIYVSFGSVTVMTNEQLLEFAWGLANSNHFFVWVVRPDILMGDSPVLPSEFLNEVKDRGLLVSWCDQEKVLKHSSIAACLTHCGWNTTLECITGGVPVICWPFFADQPTNCYYSCSRWGIGVELSSDVKRDDVQKRVRELMEEEKGEEMRRKALEWKKLAEEATQSGGSSWLGFDMLVNYALSLPKNN